MFRGQNDTAARSLALALSLCALRSALFPVLSFLCLLCGRLNALFGTHENADEYVCACACVCCFIRYPLSAARLSNLPDAGSACTPVAARDRYPCSRSQWPRARAPLQQEQEVIQRCTTPHTLSYARALSFSFSSLRCALLCLADNFPSRLFARPVTPVAR